MHLRARCRRAGKPRSLSHRRDERHLRYHQARQGAQRPRTGDEVDSQTHEVRTGGMLLTG